MKQLLYMVIGNDVAELKNIRQAIRDCLGTVMEERLPDILLAADEAIQNCILHAFPPDMKGKITLQIQLNENSLEMIIEDTAPLIDLEEIRHREMDDLREGGLGTYFISKICDKAEWSHHEGCNRVAMNWYLTQAYNQTKNLV